MTERDFAKWLKGFYDISQPETINEKQTDLIRKHLALVFKHSIDPTYSDDPKVLEEMQKVHDGDWDTVKVRDNDIPRRRNGKIAKC